MADSLPKLRGDLKISRQRSAGEAVYVVKDPASEAFFRLQEAERFIVEQLDGETPLDIVRQRTEERFGASLSAATLQAFVDRLGKAGLLEAGDGSSKADGRRGRLRGSVLYLRYALLDPDRILTYLVRRVRFFFTRGFLVLSGALILLAAGVVMANGREIAQDVPRLLDAGTIPLFLVVLVAILSAHEFAHGLTCKHFGGEVHEMGAMLLYFQPAFYCNVSDAWLFPEKSKRLWVSFAGAYFELFLWALATLAWRVTYVETWINSVALLVMMISGVKSLFNFNPFIKLDGYYLLSDYLDIPNLRRKAFAYFGASLKRWAGFGSEMAAGVTRRERRIYLAYGSVATIFSLSLMLYLFVKAGGLFIELGQPLPLALLTMFLGLRSRQRFRKLFGRSSDPDQTEDGEDVGALFYGSRAAESSARQADGAEASSSAFIPEPARSRDSNDKKKRSKPWRPRIFWGALGAAALALLVFGRMQLRIGGAFNVLPEDNADVRAEVEGIIEKIYVDEGDSVQVGDPIARLSGRDMRVELRKVEADVEETRANLRKLLAGPTAAEIEVARAGVAKAEDRLTFAGTRVSRLRELFEMNLVARQELETAQEQRATAENDLAEARARLDVLLRGSRPEEIDATSAQLQRLEAQRRYLEGQLQLLEIVSPVSGIVATPTRELMTREGQLVRKGDLIAKVYDVNTVTAQIHVSEKDVGPVRVGQPVVLRARAYPDTTFRGTVTQIATAAEGLTSEGGETAPASKPAGAATAPSKTFIVTTRIDNRSLLLKPGMSGHAKVLGSERSILALLTRSLYRLFRVEFWSWW